jgi:hypothetical protein
MGIFDGIERVAAEGTSLKQYFEVGHYIVIIDSVFIHERRLGGGKLFIVETTVDESTNPNIKPGERRNWVQSFAIPSALPRIKTFIGAANGLCPQKQINEINAKITPEICNEAVSPNNPLQRKKLKLTCIPKITQAGKTFVQHLWEAYEAR